MKTIKNIDHLLGLPRKILHHHDVEGLAQLVLHELGHDESLGLSKAGYLIDNPDFGCMRGVAGYSSDECAYHQHDMWHTPQTFSHDMQEAPFHKRLAQFSYTSLQRLRNDEIDEDDVHALAQALGMSNPSLVVWRMKHGNNGLLLFEHDAHQAAHHKEIIQNVAPILSLC
jgi:hypothetical protein